jgi:hypothetical protein
MLMKRALFLWMFLLALALIGCASAVSSNPADYVGEYVLRPNGSAPPSGFGSFLILKPDNVAIEIRFDKGSGQVETTQEKWHLSRGTGQTVVLGNFSAAVGGSSSAIKLEINEYGQYYEKVR